MAPLSGRRSRWYDLCQITHGAFVSDPRLSGPLGSDAIAAAHYAAIVKSSEDAIVSKTLDGIITSWNPAAERIFGYTAAEAVGQHIRLIIPPERWDEEEQVLARLRRGESIEHFDTVRRAKDGRFLDVSLTISPVRDATGRLVGASKIGRDVSDRKRVERELDEYVAKLEGARAEAARASRMKDEFLAMLSHELRTPLNAVYGWARLLRSGQVSGEAATKALDVIMRNAQSQIQLIDDLLETSRIVTGKMRLDLRPLDLRSVIEAAVDAVRPAADAKGIRLRTTLGPRGVAFVGDPDRLQQVTWNLLTNSVKFTPKGGQIGVDLNGGETHVVVTVSDTGQGIGADVLPHIFERFRQGDSTSTRAHGGLGLGLALVRHLVEAHGGTVTAESPGEGQGATFTIRLPLAIPLGESSDDGAANAGEDRSSAPEPRPSLAGVRVLVVDDDRDSLDLAASILTKAGAETRACSSASDGLAEFKAWRPDVLVSDIQMEAEDGYALIRRVRSLDHTEGGKTPAIALTAYGRMEDRLRTLSAGFTMHVPKPIDPLELTTLVANAAGR
jgi:PAS domain S-box-containing protein